MNPSIEAKNLSKRYGSLIALDSLNLKIEGPKCVGFLGPNGAGKTTTLKIFCDMIRASSGEAYLNGIEISKNKKRALESCGVLIESPEIYPSLTAKEALTMFAEIKQIPKGERRKRVEEVGAQVRMSEWMDKKFGEFSRGMKQRINIAAALLNDPDILLLDEPTTGLDPRGMIEVRAMISSIKQEKCKLIFMSSHLLNEVSELCDEIAMIDKGRLLSYDTVHNITSQFAEGSRAVDVSFSKPVELALIKSALSDIQTLSIEKLDQRNIRIRFSGDLRSQESIVSHLVASGLVFVSFKVSSSALEDAYLQLISETV